VDDVLEALAETVDERNDLIAAFNGEGSAGTEIILDVDDEEGVGGTQVHEIKFCTGGFLVL
jgi:hypothetical protein